MNKLFTVVMALLLIPTAVLAAYPPTVGAPNNPIFYFHSPDTASDFHGPYCEDGNFIVNTDTTYTYRMSNCSTTPVYTQVFPILPAQMDIAAFMQTIMGSPNIGAMTSAMFTGTTAQYVRGDGSVSALPTIPTNFDNLSDGTTNKAYTATEKTKLAGIATAATANSSDATLLNRANHTGAQAESTVTNLTTDLANKAQLYSGGTLKTNTKAISKHATVSGGIAVFYLTDNELVGGNALCANAVWDDSINVYVNDATASFQWSEAVTNSNKTLTVTINKLTTANILTGILGQSSAPNGTVVRLTVLCD